MTYRDYVKRVRQALDGPPAKLPRVLKLREQRDKQAQLQAQEKAGRSAEGTAARSERMTNKTANTLTTP